MFCRLSEIRFLTVPSQSEASSQPGFSEQEKAALTKLRSHLRKNLIKARYNPKGEKVGYMTPKHVDIPLAASRGQDEKASSSAGSVRWICLEYFSVRKYSGLSAASNQAMFPSQTLMQAHYSRTSRQRDMEQAICSLGNAGEGQCFHIEQLWCLILNSKPSLH